jgi:hyaluronoglucosaminidase
MKILVTRLTVVMLCFSITFAQTPQKPKQTSNPLTAQPTTLPAIFPAPVSVELGKGSIVLGKSVILVVAPGTDLETVALVQQVLKYSGVETVATTRQLPSVLGLPHIILGTGNAVVVRSALGRCAAVLDNHKEGYTIACAPVNSSALITLAGHDADGLFHAVQNH